MPLHQSVGCLVPENQSDEAVSQLRVHLESLDDWAFTAVSTLASACKSTLLALAAAHHRGAGAGVSVAAAIALSRIAEEYQIAKWGLVEGGHDLDRADANISIAAPVVFSKLCAMRGQPSD